MEKGSFTMASRTMPLRDELVLNIDDVVPKLKSDEGILVLKHTKRGQSDPRRLRLGTDNSTLEVFRRSTTASFLNRKMSNRTYYLRTLEEVGLVTSVPGLQGGMAATPGRTLVFVFRNRSLYVTVETREICAALLALFRPAGIGAQASYHAAPLTDGCGSGASTVQASEDGDLTPASSSPSGSAAERRYASPWSPLSDASSVSGGGCAVVSAPGNTRGVSWTHEGNLMRSDSETARAELLGVNRVSASSSDEEVVEAGVVSTATAVMGSSLERSRQRSPQGAPESPDAIMRSRMLGFGLADLGIADLKPKRPGRTSSIRPRWSARFTDDSSTKEGTPVGPTTTAAAAMAAQLDTIGLTVQDFADPEEDAGYSITDMSRSLDELRGTDGGPATTARRGRHFSTRTVSKLTVQNSLSRDEYAAPSPSEAETAVRFGSSSLPFATTPGAAAAAATARGALNSNRGSRGSRGKYRRGSGGTDCTSPGSPPGGAVGEVRASLIPHPTGTRAMPMIPSLHLSSGALRDKRPQGPSGFEELWAVLEPEYDINASFGASFAPKVMLLGDIYANLRSFQAAVASVCVRACGPVLAEVCGRCARVWAVLISTSVQEMVDCKDLLSTIQSGIVELVDVVKRYEAAAVVRRFTLPLIGVNTAWEEILAAGEGGDLQEPCLRIEEAIAKLPEKERDGGKRGGSLGGGGDGPKGGRQSLGSAELRLPPCPSYWAKGQFDQLTPNRLADISTLLREPTRFAELAELVTRASDVGPQNREYSVAWDCVRRVEGPALGRELRRALSATLVAAGELCPLPRVPPPPPAYVPREQLTQQIEAAILRPFLPLRIAGIGGASGSGKTVLAAAVVRDASVRCRFGDGVFWLHAGKGANHRLVSLLQDLADTVYAWLTDSEQAPLPPASSSSSSSQRRRAGSGGQAGGDAGDRSFADPNLREPVRFRDQCQAVNYIADLCRGSSLGGLRCLVVLDDVHEREVVDALWKSGCHLLVTSPVDGLLRAVGAEATMAAPLELDLAKEFTRRAAGEAVFCEDAYQLVSLCRGCPLALAMSGAIVQAMLRGGNEGREYREPWLPTPRTTGEDVAGSGKVAGPMGSTWSLSTLTAPVGAWVEQVVVGTSASPPANRQRAGDSDKKRRPATVPEEEIHANDDGAVDEQGAAGTAEAGGPQRGREATAWANLTRRVNAALKKLRQSRTLPGLLADEGPDEDMAVRELVAVLTELAIHEADRILGDSGRAMECYLSFALLPEGLPLPPPALQEFWRSVDGQGGGKGAGGNIGYAKNRGGGGSSGFAESRHRCPPAPVEVFEALRLVGRAGGGEGADGLIAHGLQRVVVLCMIQRYPDTMQKMVRRRVEMLSRISSLVGTLDDSFWGLQRVGGGGGDGEMVDAIPSGLLGSRRPGPPSHGYGGFSRYDYLRASWDALPPPHTLTSATARYVSSVRAACQAAAAAAASDGGGAASAGDDAAARGGWAAARALASVADLQALADARPEAIRTYGEACALLEAEAARTVKMAGVPHREQAARDAHHKVASMVHDLSILVAQFGKEVPAIRLLQRAVEMHLSALEASGVLVPRFAGVNEHRAKLRNPDAEAMAAAAAAAEETHGTGAGITYRAVVDDVRPIASRLWLRSSVGIRQRPASGRGGRGGGGGNPPAFGRLDVVNTFVEDLQLVLACTRTLQQEQKVEESVQLAEKVYPVLKEILGADHAFTKTALAVFVGQDIVDECWPRPDVEGSGGPALPTPTSRRRLARSSGGRGVSADGIVVGGGDAGGLGVGSPGSRCGSTAQHTTGSSQVVLTRSDLCMPPSPIPEEFSRMQQEYDFQHLMRRARAHAFLVTAATRARLMESNEKKGSSSAAAVAAPAAAAAMTAGFKTTGLAVEDLANVEENAWDAYTEGSSRSSTGGGVVTTPPHGRRGGPSHLGIRGENLSHVESLRRSASAPASVLASEARESSCVQNTPSGEHSVKSRTVTTEGADEIADDAPLREEILAKSLGPNPVTYMSTCHGVELEVLSGSLSEEVHHPVTVSPRLEFVECRTEGSGRAPSHEDGSKEEFIAMTFVHGPEEASFLDEKPASLRFFLGYVDEFAPGDGSDRVVDDKDIERHVLETYRPLTSPDGVNDWTVLGHYSVLFPPPVLGDREVWVETALKHFCIVANGVRTAVVPNIPGYSNDKPSDRPYYKGDIAGLFGRLRRKLKGGSAPPMVRFGNATQKYATFTYYPRIEQTTIGQGSDAFGEVGVGGVSVGAGRGKESLAEGCSLPAARRPITKTIRAGTYQDCEMPCGLSAHPQMNVRIGLIENLKDDNSGTLQILDEDLISGNRILVLRPVRLEMLHQFSKMPWPSTALAIMNHEA